MQGVRVIYFGMDGAFSAQPLAAILADGHEVVLVVTPRPAMAPTAGAPSALAAPPRRPRGLPLLIPYREPTIIDIARERGIPVLEVSDLRDPQTVDMLRNVHADIIAVACFPLLLPPRVLALAPHGALNVHPSLLPQYRGPSPLFWIFYDGLDRAGVTVHRVDGGTDTGPIVAQRPVALADGVSYAAAERLCAEQGARLLADALSVLGATGRVASYPQSAPDPNTPLPRAPLPVARDFVVTPDWSARRAFNFVRGLAAWDHTIVLQGGDRLYAIREALSYDGTATMSEVVRWTRERLDVRCSPGVLTVRAEALP